MDLVANIFAAALLLVLLASRATDATPVETASAASRQRGSFAETPRDLDVSRAEESADVNNEAGELPGASATWLMEEDVTGDVAQSGGGGQNLPESWNSMGGMLSKRIRTLLGANERTLKVPDFMQKLLADIETQKELARIAVGLVGMFGAGVALHEMGLLSQMLKVSLYVTAFDYLIKNGVDMLAKTVPEVLDDPAVKIEQAVRQKLASLLGIRRDTEGAADGLEG